MTDYLAPASRAVTHAAAIIGWTSLILLAIYSISGAFAKVDIAIAFVCAALFHMALQYMAEMDHYTVTIRQGDPYFDDLLRKIQEENDDEG